MNAAGPVTRGTRKSLTIVVLLTVHNRKAHTLECLARLYAQRLPAYSSMSMLLVDDGCTDGTPDAVRRQFPEVRIIRGTGGLYWNGGMRVAFSVAERGDPEFYLLLNDDTSLDVDALARLVRTSEDIRASRHSDAIVVGSTRDPLTGAATYGGQNRIGRWSPGFALVQPGAIPKRCDTFNGNCVLIPRSVARKVGNLSPEFTHAFGDIDYGLRAARAGFSCWIAPDFVGTCALNSNRGSFVDRSLPVLSRWRKMLGVKGTPLREWRAFTSKHCGPFWPVYWVRTYAVFWARALVTILATVGGRQSRTTREPGR